jgi:hypothetical protein
MCIQRRIHLLIAAALTAALLSGASKAGEETPPPPSVVVKVTEGGFHWSDAAIGATAAIAAVVLVLGLVLTFRSTGRGIS